MNITFCGAAQRVTGSNYLIETNSIKFLVDCGMFQGNIGAEQKNYEDFPYDPKKIDFVLITHSHIDHIGRLPLLYKRGFRGKIYSTKPTAEFAKIFLEDTANLSLEKSQETGQEPLYEIQDVENVCKLFETYDYYQEFYPQGGINVKFYDAGHILGSAIIEVKAEGKTVIFSGDLGNPPVPILRDTDFIEKADYIVMESTYGSRNHAPFETRQLELERVIENTIKNKGTLLIPAFAMERTQEIIYEINDLAKNNKIPQVPVYIDSPLAIKATAIYKKYPQYFDIEARKLMESGQNFFDSKNITLTDTREDSKKIDQDNLPKIIIAGSGMSNGGRILFHEKKYLPINSTTLLIIGFQVKGTLGGKLIDDEKKVNILGENIIVRANITEIEAYSAHADQQRLLYWLSKFNKGIKKIFLVHGEIESQDALLHKIQDEQGLEVEIPEESQSIEI